jgi:hypothetical protein
MCTKTASPSILLSFIGGNSALDRVRQVLEDVLGMVQLGTGEVRGVAADIGEGQAAGLGLPYGRMPRAGHSHATSLLPRFHGPLRRTLVSRSRTTRPRATLQR